MVHNGVHNSATLYNMYVYAAKSESYNYELRNQSELLAQRSKVSRLTFGFVSVRGIMYFCIAIVYWYDGEQR